MLELVERYRRRAEDALAMMSSEADPEAREVLAGIAEAWLSLATQAAEKADQQRGEEQRPGSR